MSLPSDSTISGTAVRASADPDTVGSASSLGAATTVKVGYEKFRPSATLKSRSYVGLLLSQFLAAFNDQASHIVALFYATDMLVRFAKVAPDHIDTKALISIVTACFITPFFLFSPLAGVLADKYSKRSIIVFWKLAEVFIMTIALVGFLLPHAAGLGFASADTLAIWSSILVISVVFMMGTHSTFFIPAKYGVMPELLHTSILSRGNGLLEGTSFAANILGTVFGGWLYGTEFIKSNIEVSGAATVLHPGREWIIGTVLLGFAVLGVISSLLVEHIPPAAPHKPMIWEPWTPMKQNLGLLRKSKSLVLATIGIAFFLFMTLYLRQTLLFQGETKEEVQRAIKLNPAIAEEVGLEKSANPEQLGKHAKDAKTEFEVALLIGFVGLGVGIGCSLAGYFSGNRLELGLVPIGLALLIVCTATMAVVVPHKARMIACLIAVGTAAGLYIVPLYTLLQHRAPKESKGSLVATSNFLNVTGGLIAVIVFFLATAGLQFVLDLKLHYADARSDPLKVTAYLHQLVRESQIPKLLFLGASLVTIGMLLLLWWQRPDFMLRAISWLRSSRRRHLQALGLDNIPANGQVILVSNCRDFNHWVLVVSTLDRFARFVAPHDTGGDDFLRSLAVRNGVMIAAGPKIRLAEEDHALARGLVTLGQGNILGLSLEDGYVGDHGQQFSGEHLLAELRNKVPAGILPVYCGENPIHPEAGWKSDGRTFVAIGEPLAANAHVEEIRAAIAALGS
ncbi:MAG: MFS transporter [Pirellulales bacterium]|nr:MFS transporter [Pirellulales bacterium]